MSYTTYRTKGGERWDTIANEAYGNPLLYNTIVKANPDVPVTDVLPQGISLYIPVLAPTETDTTLLPPWKR